MQLGMIGLGRMGANMVLRLMKAGHDLHVYNARTPVVQQWIEKGAKPTAQSIAAACEALRASIDGPCRYHPEFTPINKRFYPREITVR